MCEHADSCEIFIDAIGRERERDGGRERERERAEVVAIRISNESKRE